VFYLFYEVVCVNRLNKHFIIRAFGHDINSNIAL